MRRLAFLVSLFLAACTVRLPVSEPTMAPPPPVHPDVAPPTTESQAPAPPFITAEQEPKPAPAAPPAAAPPPSTPKAAPAPKTLPASPPKTAAAAPKPATPPAPAPPPLDLKSLEQRLKDTDAIGVLTKLSLKNQVDDLVGQFRQYHAGKRPPTLAELRQPFELLLMKVLSLLQDKDTSLAHDINASRDAIWGVLSDRDKLAQFT